MSIKFKINDIHLNLIKGNIQNISLNKEYISCNVVKTFQEILVGFLDDENNHCCFYLKNNDGYNPCVTIIELN